jgi:hypothetical protein
MTVAEFLGRYGDVARGSMKRRSFETYESIVKVHLLPELGDCKVGDSSRDDVQGMYSRKLDGGLSAARVRRIHGVLSSALNHAVSWRLVERNVCREVSPPRVPAPEIRALRARETLRRGGSPRLGVSEVGSQQHLLAVGGHDVHAPGIHHRHVPTRPAEDEIPVPGGRAGVGANVYGGGLDDVVPAPAV